MKRLTIFSLLLLVPSRALFACDAPHGNAVATPQTTPACSYLEAAIGLNEQTAFGAFSSLNVGFGILTGSVTGAPLTLEGSYVSLPAPIDPVVAVPQVATDGTDFLVVEYSSGATSYRLVHANGTMTSRALIVNKSGTSGSSSGSAAVVWDGNEYLVLTTAFEPDTTGGGYVPSVVGAVVRPDGSLVSTTTVANNAVLLTAVRSGNGAMVIRKHGTAVEASLFSGAGASSQVITLPVTDAIKAAAATNGSATLVAFTSGSGVQIMTSDASLNSRNVQTIDPTFVNEVEVVADGSSFLVLRSDPSLSAKATRVTGTTVGSTFALANGDIVSAASNSHGAVVLSSYGCGTIQSQFIAHGATTASAPVDLTLIGTPQRLQKTVTTGNGHEIAYFEGKALYVQPVDNNANPGARTKLSDLAQSFSIIGTSNGGSAIAWEEGATGNVLRLARFDASGNQRGTTIDVPATPTINSVALAEAGDTLLLAYTGIVARHPEVHADLINSGGALTQDAVVSNSTDEGIDLTAGTDGSKWMIAWRSGRGGAATVIETPQTDVRTQTRKDLALPATGVPAFGAVGGGNLYWLEQAADGNYLVHRTNISGTDTVLGQSEDVISNVRLAGSTPLWVVQSHTSASVMSLSGLLSCFDTSTTGVDVEYDVRNGAVSTFLYYDGTQLRVENATVAQPATPTSRHRAVHH